MTNKPSQHGRLTDKVALITGSGSGIGKATAQLFAQEGARIAIADLDEARSRQVAEEIASSGGRAVSYVLDVTNEHDWQRVISDLLTNWAQLDILVNNAGISFAKPVIEMTLDEWRRVTAVNLDGVFLGTRAACNAMTNGGKIINVASASGIKASPGASAYCASKAAVRMFSKAAALECAAAGTNIRINTVSPGAVMTPMWESMEFWQQLKGDSGADQAYRALSEGVPLKRMATAEEVAKAILYLASDESSYVTGADLVVDGGFTA